MKLNRCLFLLMANSQNIIIISVVKYVNVLKELDSDPASNTLLKAKIKSGKNSANFFGKVAPKVGLYHICIPMILIYSILQKGVKYYQQLFLENCKYIMKNENKIRYINEEVELLLMKISMIMNHLNSARYGSKRSKNLFEDEKRQLII